MDVTQNIGFIDYLKNLPVMKFITKVYVNDKEDLVFETSNISSLKSFLSMILRGKKTEVKNKSGLLEIIAGNMKIKILQKVG